MSEGNGELPTGWEWSDLKTICRKITDGTHHSPAKELQTAVGDYKYITAKNIKTHGIIFDDVTYVSEKVHRPIFGRCNPERGDVLYIKDGVTTGIATVNQLDEEFSLLSSVALLKPFREAVSPHFLKWYLNSPTGFRAMTSQMGGTAIKRLTLKKINDGRFPVAPLAEQRRIVAKIEALQERSRNARKALAEVGPLLEQFRQSLLAAAFRGDLTADWRAENPDVEPAREHLARIRTGLGKIKTRRGVPSGVQYRSDFRYPRFPETWHFASVGDLLHLGTLIDVKDGNHGANHPKSSQFTNEGLPFITAAQVRDYQIDYDGSPKVSGEPLEKLRVGFTEINDVVVTHKGTVGRTAMNTSACVLTPQTTYYRCRSECMHPRYLMYYQSSPVFQEQLVAVMSQTTRNFVPLSEQYNLFLLIPPLNEQAEIVRVLDSAMEQSQNLQNNLVESEANLGQLDQSILAKAFRGELVAQDPQDEPAAVVLERIRRQREAAAQNGKPKRKTIRTSRKKKA